MSTATQDELAQREEFESSTSTTVRQEIETFRQRAQQFLAGEITEDEFRPFRLKHGIYGQRQAGVQMVRCKIPGGLLTAAPGRAIRRASPTNSAAAAATSPRARTSSITSCRWRAWPTSCTCWPTPASPIARPATTPSATSPPAPGPASPTTKSSTCAPTRSAWPTLLLRKDLTGNLPRKFKIAFDGCAGQRLHPGRRSTISACAP